MAFSPLFPRPGSGSGTRALHQPAKLLHIRQLLSAPFGWLDASFDILFSFLSFPWPPALHVPRNIARYFIEFRKLGRSGTVVAGFSQQLVVSICVAELFLVLL